jgi:hypothetical protein
MLNAANRSDTEVMPLIGKIISLSSSLLLFISSDGIFVFLLGNTLEDDEIFLFFCYRFIRTVVPRASTSFTTYFILHGSPVVVTFISGAPSTSHTQLYFAAAN